MFFFRIISKYNSAPFTGLLGGAEKSKIIGAHGKWGFGAHVYYAVVQCLWDFTAPSLRTLYSKGWAKSSNAMLQLTIWGKGMECGDR